MKSLLTLVALGLVTAGIGCQSDDANPPLNTAEMQNPGHGNNGYSPTDPGRRGSVGEKFGPATEPATGTTPNPAANGRTTPGGPR